MITEYRNIALDERNGAQEKHKKEAFMFKAWPEIRTHHTCNQKPSENLTEASLP